MPGIITAHRGDSFCFRPPWDLEICATELPLFFAPEQDGPLVTSCALEGCLVDGLCDQIGNNKGVDKQAGERRK